MKTSKKKRKYFNKLTLNFYTCFVPNKVLATSDEKKAKKETLKDRRASERRKTVVCGVVLEFTFSFIQQKNTKFIY